jgi:hypothetical protein
MTDVRAETSLDASTVARLKQAADAAGKAEFVLDAELTDPRRCCGRDHPRHLPGSQAAIHGYHGHHHRHAH